MELSIRERDRLSVLRQVSEGYLRPSSAARKLGLSSRQIQRLMQRFRNEGDQAAIHRARGRQSNHRLPKNVKAAALREAANPLFSDFGPTLLAEHLSKVKSIGPLSPYTLRLWLIESGQWKAETRKLQHREWRERRAAFGELVQMDTSVHAWFEKRSIEPVVLIAMIDDATSTLVARFAPSDSGTENRRLIIDYLRRYGRMRALYTDRASHFRSQTTPRRLKQLPAFSSTIQSALGKLDIELITALSPQAKGRVERLFGTLQDRLLKELRIRNISTIAEANQFLERDFLPQWNSRFTKTARDHTDAHRPLSEHLDLMDLFAESEERLINPDFTVRYQNHFYQIGRREAMAQMPGSTLRVSRRIDGSLGFTWRGRKLELQKLPALPESPQPIRPAHTPHSVTKPAANHPWRNAPSLCRSEN